MTSTRERIEDAFGREAANPRLHHLWLKELIETYRQYRDLVYTYMSNPQFTALAKKALVGHDVLAMRAQTTVYRVALHPDRDDIEVVSIGMERVDTEPDRVYANFSKLPTWMQEKLHVMAMLDDTAPTEHIEGLGRRISKYVFWLEIPTKENNHG